MVRHEDAGGVGRHAVGPVDLDADARKKIASRGRSFASLYRAANIAGNKGQGKKMMAVGIPRIKWRTARGRRSCLAFAISSDGL